MNCLDIMIALSISIIFFSILYNIFTGREETCEMRYNKLKKSSLENYIKNYKDVKKCTKDKVVVSLTSTPKRIKHITPMLNSLLDQTVRVDQIVLNIPENDKYQVPEEYKNVCNIFTTGKDYGSGTKFIPTLLREGECGVKIILLDDDYIYGKDLIETLVKESDKHPGKSIYTGDEFKASGGILIKPEFINKINHGKCDDKWLENNLIVDKIKINYNKNKKYI